MKELDQLYYIGDAWRPTYENHNGGALQKNLPHFVELAGALAIFNFADDVSVMTDRTEHGDTVAYEYGLKADREEFDFSNLHGQSLKLIRKPLTKFLLMRNYFAQALDDSWSKSWASSHEPIFNSTSVNENRFYDELSKFMESFAQWLEGMAKNKR